MKVLATVLVMIGLVFTVSSVNGDQTIRDYYSEPGLNPFKEPLGQSFNENIDTFSGGLMRSYTDVFIPGNGGFDIVIHRTYNSVQDALGPPGVNGLGWTMHMGRIVVSSAYADRICTQSSWATSVRDNPSIEFADGGRELLVLATDPNAYLITRSRWKAECNNEEGGLLVTSPDGTQYTMSQYSYVGGEVYWYATKIEDRNGNILEIEYQARDEYVYISRIVADDGRSVTFEYAIGDTSVLLSKVIANGQTWSYSYIPVIGLGGDAYHHLKEVERPDGTKWKYEYHPQYVDGSAGSHALKQATYPYGGTIEYSYEYVYFEPGVGLPTTVISQKNVGGADVASGVWTFEYTPGASFGSANDKTVVNTPNGTHVYYHWGYSGVGSGSIWRIGLQHAREVYDGDILIEQEINTWGGQSISTENYWHGRNTLKVDNDTQSPVLEKRYIWRRDGSHETEFSNYDNYGNPGTIFETGNFYVSDPGSPETRTTSITYYIDAAKWIVNLKKDETIDGFGTISRVYDDFGNMLSENRYGVQTTYTYTSRGDVETETNARGKVTTFENYMRGIPQRVVRPGVVETRTVNPTGTVATETNGRGFIKAFTYDQMNRLESIDFPLNADVAISRSNNVRVLTRGNYEREDILDGFARPIQVIHRDTVNNIAIVTTKEYDALGNTVFESNPNSMVGTRYKHDVLGRLVRTDHADGAFIAIHHNLFEDKTNTEIVNERGIATRMLYGAYGDPDGRFLLRVDSPENIQTGIRRDLIGQVTRVRQGVSGGDGVSRHYGYDDRKFLVSRFDPEIGLTTYGRDEVGNMISRQVADQEAIIYSYDDLGRLKTIDYPGYQKNDATYTYDENSNVRTVLTPLSKRTYDFDQNDNPLSELLTIYNDFGQIIKTHSVHYTYDELDSIDTIQYPSGRILTYSPDALGRPTQAMPYVPSFGYHPNGLLARMEYANGQVTDIDLDNDRLWLSRIHAYNSDNSTSTVDVNYSYDESGNIERLIDALDNANNLVLTYDLVDRLESVEGPWGNGSMLYDAYGNIKQKIIGNEQLDYMYAGMKLERIIRNGSAIRILAYDSYGNVTALDNPTDAYIPDYRYFYNHSGDMYSVTGASKSHKYVYDGEHRLVKSQVGWDTTHFLYTNNGNLMGEYLEDGVMKKEYVYLGGKLLASIDNLPPHPEAKSVTGAFEGETVSLDGSDSHAFDSSIVSYQWVQVAGPEVSITDPTQVMATFVVPAVPETAVLQFQLTITDNTGMTASASVEVSAWGTVPPPAITNISAVQGEYENNITWDAVGGAESYRVYWSTSRIDDVSVAYSIDVVGNNFLHENLSSGVEYFYLVSAINRYGETISDSEIRSTVGVNGWVHPFTIKEHVDNYQYVIDGNGTYTFFYIDHGGIVAQRYADDTGWGEAVVIIPELFSVSVLSESSVHVNKHTGNIWGLFSYHGAVFAVHYSSGHGWSPPMEVYPVSDPFRDGLVIRSDDNGNVLAAWRDGNETKYIYAARYDSVQREWSIPEIIVTNLYYQYAPVIQDIVMDVDGNAVLVYTEGSQALMSIRYDRALQMWGDTQYVRVGTFYNPRIAANKHGVILIRGRNASHQSLYYWYDSGADRWSLGDTGPQVWDGIPLLDQYGNAMVLAIEDSNEGKGDAVTSYSYAPGVGWTGREIAAYVGNMDLGQFAAAINDEGKVAVIVRKTTDENSELIYGSYFTREGGWRDAQIFRRDNYWGYADGYDSTLELSVTLLEDGAAAASWGARRDNLYRKYDADISVSRYLANFEESYTAQSIPVAYAGGMYQGEEGQTITLDGNGSFSSGGELLEYHWQQLAGPLADPPLGAGPAWSINLPEMEGNSNALLFELEVKDSNGNLSWDQAFVEIQNRLSPPEIQVVSGDTENHITWSDYSHQNADSYNLYWSNAPGVTKETGFKVEGVVSPYEHNSLINGVNYYYVVTSVNTYGAESKESFESSGMPEKQYWDESNFIHSTGSIRDMQLLLPDGDKPISIWVDSNNVIWGSEYDVSAEWGAPIALSDSGINKLTFVEMVSDKSGNAFLVWIEGTYQGLGLGYADVLKVRKFEKDAGWQSPVIISSWISESSSYDGIEPSIYMNRNGVGVVAWAEQDPDNNRRGKRLCVKLLHSDSWGETECLVEMADGSWVENPLVAIDDNDRAILVWAQFDSLGTGEDWFYDYDVKILARSYDPGNGWGDAVAISDNAGDPGEKYIAEWPSMAMNQAGEAVVAWNKGTNEISDIYVSRYSPDNGWEHPEYAHANSSKYDAIAINQSGDAMIVWVAGATSYRSIYAKRFSKEIGWMDQELISNPDQTLAYDSSPDISNLSDGSFIVTWIGSEHVMMNHFMNDGSWTGPMAVSWDMPPGHDYISVDEASDGVIWSGWFNMADQVLLYSKYHPDSFGSSENTAPVAVAGNAQSVFEGQSISLDASSSYDPDGEIVDYQWSQLEGTPVAIHSSNTAISSFEAPRTIEGVDLLFQLQVTDNDGAVSADTVAISVQMLDTGGNGISDQWEMDHFGWVGIAPDGDADGDGISNLDEFLQGTNPLDGDVNGDGELNVADLLLAYRHVLGKIQLNPAQEETLDLAPPGGNGVVDLGDIVVLQRRIMAAH